MEIQQKGLNLLQSKYCGLYKASKSMKHNQHALQLPLKKIQYQINICDGIAEVNSTQLYFNNSDQFMEVQFRFPLPPHICLHKFIATFDNKKMQGIIKEKIQAKEEYKKAVSEGKKAAYGAINEQKDIMCVCIGNIGPKTQVKIQISYIEELTIALNTFYCFNLQTNLTPKYLNKLSKNGLLNSFRNKSINRQFQWDFELSIRSFRKIAAYHSTTHSLKLTNKNDSNTVNSFTFNDDSLGKNFNFYYTTEDFHLPSYVLGKTDQSTTLMVSFIPKFCSLNLGDAQIAIRQNKQFQPDLDSTRGQFLFLLDRSGSMDGDKINSAKKSLVLFLKSLPINSYFNVISFGTDSISMFDKSVPNNNQNISNAVKKINKMGADMGGTQLSGPLLAIFTSEIIKGYPRQIFLLTDGEVSNTEEIIQLVRRNIKYSRFHTIGIGRGASSALIRGCALNGKGNCIFINDNQNPAQKIIKLLNDSLSAVITSVKLQFDQQLVERIVPNPFQIPYILKGDPLNFFITFKGSLTSSTQVSLFYEDSVSKNIYSSSIAVDPQGESFAFIDKIGHYKSIKCLEDEGISIEEMLFYVKKVDKKKEIIDLSIKNQILSKFTAFICAQSQLVDGKYQQIKDRGTISFNIQKIIEKQEFQQCQQQQLSKYYQFYDQQLQQDNNQNSLFQMAPKSLFLQPMQYQHFSTRDRGSRGSRGSRGGDRGQAKHVRYQKSRIKSRQRSRSRNKSRNKSRKIDQTAQKNRQIQTNKKSKAVLDNEGIKNIIVSDQKIEGYWDNIQIIKKLYPQKLNEVQKETYKKDVVITTLVLKWIKENIASKELYLIVRKAVSWLKKQQSFQQCCKIFAYIPQ